MLDLRGKSDTADRAFRWIAGTDEVRVVVVTGEGDEFCAGADLSAAPDAHWLAYMRSVNEGCLALHAVPQPTIARVDGIAAGAFAATSGKRSAVAADQAVQRVAAAGRRPGAPQLVQT